MAHSSTRKDTWWNRLRVERNFTFKDLADALGGSRSKWGNYFSGAMFPTEVNMRCVCSFFNVPLELGRKYFLEAHESYVANQKVPTISSGKRSDAGQSHKVIRAHLKPKGDAEPIVEKAVETPSTPSLDKVYSWAELPAEKQNELTIMLGRMLGEVYGKISYPEFLELSRKITSKSEDPLAAIYSKVDYDTFKSMYHRLAEWNLLTCCIDLDGMSR